MKKILILTLALIMCLSSFTSCGLFNWWNNKTETRFEVWSTYNTVKVIRQTTNNSDIQKLGAVINVEMMMNEYEGGQIIFTTENEATYKLEAAELVSAEGNKFPLSNIEVYHQKYIKIEKNNSGNSNYPSGSYIPDMLMPMDKAVEYNENTVPANSNQGITVEFNSANVPAGVYTGTFTLTVNEETREIPAMVTVWDFEYEGRRTFQSSFLLYRDQLLAGEYDASDEMVQKYADFFNRYKIDIYTIKDSASKTLEDFINFAKRMYQSDNTASIIIPVDFPRSYVAYNGDKLTATAQKAVDYILAAAELSTLDEMYTDLLYFYPSSYDEADINGYDAASEAFYKKGGEYDQTIAAAVAAIDTDDRFADVSPELKAALKESIAKIPAVFTNVNFVDKWVGELSASFCPYSSLFNDESIAQKYQDAANANSNGNLWIYTCVGPTYPYGTFHIDDGTLGMRASGWIEKANKITGYLYYAVNMNTQFMLSGDVYTDIYNNPLRYYTTPGDGYLTYPGKYYNNGEPFATVRLVAYRDGQDDYDMLCVYEELLKEYGARYGIEIDFDEYAEDLYSSVFAGATHYTNDEIFYATRRELANRILALTENGVIVSNGKIYTPADAAVKIDGKEAEGELAGEGKAFTYDSSAEHSVEILLNGKTEALTVGKVVNVLSQTNVTTSDGSEATLGDAGLSVNLVSKYMGNDSADNIGVQTRMFNPYVGFKLQDLSVGDTIKFSYTNKNSKDMEFTIMLIDASGKRTAVKTNYCPEGTTRDVSIVLSEQLLSSLKVDVSSVVEIRFVFDNVVNNANGTVSLHPDRNFIVSDVRIEK